MSNSSSLSPPSLAYCVAENLFFSGSEWYRCHRPAHVIGNHLNWLTFVASRFAPPTEPGPWLIEIEGKTLCPQVIITRPIFKMEGDDSDGFEAAARMAQSIAYAQEAGQIVLIDLDDHPYGWNEEYAGRESVEPITDWKWHDDWLNQANAVLCSTRYLRDYLAGHFPEQAFHYLPNCYDPDRYADHTPTFRPRLGAHLFLKSRMRADFEQMAPVAELFGKLTDLRFSHMGEDFPCTCGHPLRDHYGADLSTSLPGLEFCDQCKCETFTLKEQPHLLSDFTGIPADRIDSSQPCSILDLPKHMDWSVGVIPLADNEWNHAKTEGKGFEMAAAGIPFVPLTGEHPLYSQAPISPLDREAIRGLLTREWTWERESRRARVWAVKLAQRHQDTYVRGMLSLANSDLRKVRA